MLLPEKGIHAAGLVHSRAHPLLQPLILHSLFGNHLMEVLEVSPEPTRTLLALQKGLGLDAPVDVELLATGRG